MKNINIYYLIIFISQILTGCEPTNCIYIRNFNDIPISIQVNCRKLNNVDAFSDSDSIWFTKKIVDKIGWYSYLDLNYKTAITRLDSNSYEVTLNKISTSLIIPKTIIPEEIIINKDNYIDTIKLFVGKNNNIQELKKCGKIKRKGFWITTTIIDLK